MALVPLRDLERLKRFERAKKDLYYLATEILGRDLLTRDYHRPMMLDMDQRRRVHRADSNACHDGEMWPRDYFKTTVREAQCVQDFLNDPTTTITWWHAVEQKAQDSVNQVGKYFLTNKALRELIPDWRPAAAHKKFVTSAGFNFYCQMNDRAKSMQGFGAGSEATGGHCRIGILDDIIGQNDIEDNLMPKKRRWLAQTVRNVVSTRGGWLRMTGTHWDSDDIYVSLRKNPRWMVRVRACYEKGGVADWDGEPMLYTREEIENKRVEGEMTRHQFACQMMNDPLPAAERMWSRESERFVEIAEAMHGAGRNIVLSDPAPINVGSLSGVKEKERGDTSKDWWSIAVVRLRVVGNRQQIILLDGSHSQDWTTQHGLEEACRLMMRWQTNLFFNESYGGLGADFTDRMIETARTMNVKLYLDKDRRLPKFSDSHASGAKNLRFEKLCDRNREGDFLISKGCPSEFLYGDNDKVGFLTHARGWRALQKGRNSLKWDDDADVVSRATDSALSHYAPRADPSVKHPWSSWWKVPEGRDEGEVLSKHVRY